MLSFFKANPKNSGTACSFWLNSKDGSFWCSLLKQASWDHAKKEGLLPPIATLINTLE